jgi:hypothetical protein
MILKGFKEELWELFYQNLAITIYARELINIPSLKERREILCEQFFLRDENLQKLDEFFT